MFSTHDQVVLTGLGGHKSAGMFNGMRGVVVETKLYYKNRGMLTVLVLPEKGGKARPITLKTKYLRHYTAQAASSDNESVIIHSSTFGASSRRKANSKKLYGVSFAELDQQLTADAAIRDEVKNIIDGLQGVSDRKKTLVWACQIANSIRNGMFNWAHGYRRVYHHDVNHVLARANLPVLQSWAEMDEFNQWAVANFGNSFQRPFIEVNAWRDDSPSASKAPSPAYIVTPGQTTELSDGTNGQIGALPFALLPDRM